MRAPEPGLEIETRSLDEVVTDAVAAFENGKDSPNAIIGRGRIREYGTGLVAEDKFIDGQEEEFHSTFGQLVDDFGVEDSPTSEFLTSSQVFERDLRDVIAAGRALFRGEGAIPLWGIASENVEHFKTVRDQAAALHEALKAMPDRARLLLFAPGVSGKTNRIPSDSTLEQTGKRCFVTVSILAGLQRRCAELIVAKPGEHFSTKFLKRWIVEETACLLERHRKQVTNSSSEYSLMRTMARLIFEGVTGKYGVDLQWACQTVLKKRSVREKDPAD
jgi:hypothetical protein